MAKRSFEVIDGGTGEKTLIRVIDPAQSAAAGGNGGGGVTSIFKLDVARDVQWMKALWAFLVPALASFFIYFIGEMKDVRKDIANVTSAVTGQTQAISDMQRSLDRIESRLDTRDDNHPQASPGAGQAGAVHPGTRGGGKPNG
jgi:hypothetical protein